MPRAPPNAPPDHTWCLLANTYLNIHTPAHTPSHILVLSYPYKTRTTNEYLPTNRFNVCMHCTSRSPQARKFALASGVMSLFQFAFMAFLVISVLESLDYPDPGPATCIAPLGPMSGMGGCSFCLTPSTCAASELCSWDPMSSTCS